MAFLNSIKKQIYGISEYAKDKANGTAGNLRGYIETEPVRRVVYNPTVTPMVRYPSQTTPVTAPEVVPTPAPVTAPEVVQTPTPVTAPEVVPTPTPVTVPTATKPKTETQSPQQVETNILAQANINLTRPLSQVELARTQMEQARQKVYEVLNSKFQYNAKESPLYSILQKQYEKEAQRAAGEAYARSVANTGGYGSSYATMVASEAGRQTMEGFNDQQLALYQAAKEEFFAERQSAVDWYKQAKLMYGDVQDEALSAAYDAAYTLWDGNNEDDVRQTLLDEGVSAEQVNTIISTLRKGKLEELQTDYHIGEYEDKAAYKSAYNTASGIWNGNNEAEVRAALAEAGVDSALIQTILSDLNRQAYEDEKVTEGREEVRYTKAYNEAITKAYGLLSSMSMEEIEAELLKDTDAATVGAVMSAMKQGKLEDLQIDTAIKELARLSSGELTEESKADLYNSASEKYTGDNKTQVKQALVNAGATEEEAAEIIDKLEAEEVAGLEDTAKNISDISSAISFKQELDRAKNNGTLSVQKYDEEIAKNSAFIMSDVNKYINDPDKLDYEALGISKATWDGLDDGDKKLAIFDAIGQLAKNGVVTQTDYYKMLYQDTKDLLTSNEYRNSKNKVRDLLDRGVVLQDLHNSGYVSVDDYTRLMTELIVPAIENTSVITTFNGQLALNLNAGVGEISDEQEKVVGDILKFLANKTSQKESSGYRGGR